MFLRRSESQEPKIFVLTALKIKNGKKTFPLRLASNIIYHGDENSIIHNTIYILYKDSSYLGMLLREPWYNYIHLHKYVSEGI